MFDLRKHLLGIAGAVALALGAAGTASAAPVAGSIVPAGPDANQAIGGIFGLNVPLNGWYEANLYLIAGGNTNITAEFLGSEASLNNSFSFGGYTPSTSGGTSPAGVWGSPISSSGPILTAPGLLNFSFTAGNGGFVSNLGVNPAPTVGANYFIMLGEAAQNQGTDRLGSGQVAYLFFDDVGSGDDNHDDMVIKLSITGGSFVVPLPAAAWLMLAGLGGLGLMSRRRSAA